MSNENTITPTEAILAWAEFVGTPSGEITKNLYDEFLKANRFIVKILGHNKPDEFVFKHLAAEVRRLREENAKLRELTQWRPIESAPRDGFQCVLGGYIEIDGRRIATWAVASWEEDDDEPEGGRWDTGSADIDLPTYLTHWREIYDNPPLPAAPESEVRP